MIISHKPEYFMHRAIELAQQAAQEGEVPIGAVVVFEGEIVGRGFNQSITRCDPTAHAEVVALRDAAKTLGNYRLSGCDLYVTLEPCTMCAGAIIHSRIRKVYYGAAEPKTGVNESLCNLFAQPWYNHKVQIENGLLAGKCKQLLKSFFAERRQNKTEQAQSKKQDVAIKSEE
ncbi:tRNA adenosine(34) deaminase TadA [Oceanospirillum multiglobuliferum]|uniref:tRNA-specific adenosine deaminase n=1 Tax=Oceanospirillum multiglobuliferum TaxID=64969 RepID=A0A1V4T6P8_9GAMM|nr:tRNA adenosine(34) deaminase TadA [Oceanospirillum multiglobuliferum]OPX56226.1 tRNA adenosine(34) deaminase TadA [Oceanospirillum multiglobuliferum]